VGISSDGIIAYGIDLGDESNLFPWAKHKYDGEFESWVLLEILGFDEDWQTYEGYYDMRKKLLDAYPIDLILHCSYEYPMYFLAVRGTKRRASRGYPTFIESFPEITSMQRVTLKKFADEHGLKCDDDKVGWHLFSVYG